MRDDDDGLADDLLGDPEPTEPPANAPRRALPPRRRRTLWWTLGILGVLAVVIAVVAGAVLMMASRALDSTTQNQGGSPIDILVPQPLENEDSGRVNVLVAGDSVDEAGHGGASLTDSIMIVSMNIETGHTALISVPRDLWVDNRGVKSKINAVSVFSGGGQAGMRVLGSEIEDVTGLRIDHYVLVSYDAVREIVDAVGGIDVTLEPGEATQDLPAGQHHLDGEQALDLARARYGVDAGDFGRQANQRKIITALIEKVTRTPALANPAAMVALFESIGQNVRTDLDASQIRRFYDLVADGVDESTSIRGSSGDPLLVDYTDPNGGAAVVPRAGMFDYTEIKAHVAEVTGR